MDLLGHEILRAVTFSDGKAGYACSRWGKWVETRTVTDDVAEVQSVAGCQVVVHPQSALIEVILLGLCRNEGIESAVGFWKEAQKVLIGKRIGEEGRR